MLPQAVRRAAPRTRHDTLASRAARFLWLCRCAIGGALSARWRRLRLHTVPPRLPVPAVQSLSHASLSRTLSLSHTLSFRERLSPCTCPHDTHKHTHTNTHKRAPRSRISPRAHTSANITRARHVGRTDCQGLDLSPFLLAWLPYSQYRPSQSVICSSGISE